MKTWELKTQLDETWCFAGTELLQVYELLPWLVAMVLFLIEHHVKSSVPEPSHL